MPIYEYLCDACDHKMEALQKMSDDPLKNCPECGEGGLRKLVSAAAFRLKGDGWYETDFKGDKDKRKNLSTSDDKPASKDSKPASKDSKKDDKKDGTGSDSGKSDSESTESKTSEKKASKPKEKKGSKKTAD